MRACLSIVLAALPSLAAAQSVLRVPDDFSTIQSAINAAVDGDTVLVGPGTYFETIIIDGIDVRLASSGGPEATTINALRAGSVVTVTGGSEDTVVSGFTITNGLHSEGGGVVVYGGQPIITGNRITGNFGTCRGSGVSLNQSAAIVYRNRIWLNHTIPGVSGGGGGGVHVGGNPCHDYSCGAQIIRNIIEDNHLPRCSGGGGIHANSAGALRIVGNVIRNNSASSRGGGISMWNDSRALIENNLIVGNSVGERGGGVYWLVAGRSPFLVNNTIVDNVAPLGAGLAIDSDSTDGRVVNNVIVDMAQNGSSMIDCDLTSPELGMPIVANNNVFSSLGSAYSGSCQDPSGQNGNLSKVPVFFADDDFRLRPSSPGIDAGENVFSSYPLDILGADRVFDGNGDNASVVDIGAYELGDVIFRDGLELNLQDFPWRVGAD